MIISLNIVPGDNEEGVGGTEQPILVGQTHTLEGGAEQVTSVRVRLQTELHAAPTDRGNERYPKS